MTYESIITKIWGPYADSDNQILRVNMAHIRRKLEENPAEPQYIFTEIGVGYRMREEIKLQFSLNLLVRCKQARRCKVEL